MSRLTRRDLLKGSLAAPLAGCGGGGRRPNIIVIVTDDQRPDAMSCYEKPSTLSFLRTPNMDRLASTGVRFRNAFVTTSLCSPSRATMLTGKYVHTHGVDMLRKQIPPEHAIFPGLLRVAGYETGFVGKWHIGARSEKPRLEFDYWAGVRGQGRYLNPQMNVNGVDREIPGYSEEVFADLALDFIRQERDRPFFLWLAHKAPHSPCTPPEHLKTLFDDIEAPLPATYYETHEDKPDWYVACHDHDYYRYLLSPPEKYNRYVKDYCRTLASVDEQLGRILDALDETGLAGDTAIFYLGDNGHFLGEHQLYSKMLPYEESMRIPLLARWPGVSPEGVTNSDLVLNVDLAPTILDLTGAAIPAGMEGRSFKAQISGVQPEAWRTSFLYEYFNNEWGVPTLECVRTAENWKYARYYDWEQLYNLSEDPIEVSNLATDPAYTARKEELIGELRLLGAGVRELKPPGEYKHRRMPIPGLAG